MIEELVGGMSELDDKRPDHHCVPEDTFARTRYMIQYPIVVSSNKWMGVIKTHVYHESTKVIL